MCSDEEFDFTIVADNIFPQDDTDINFVFDVTWKDKSSKLIINCREISRKGTPISGTRKIKSFTIPELKAVNNELSAIEPRITPYFPKEFSFKIIEIERIKNVSSWSFFSITTKSVVEEEREFSEETVQSIKNYLRAVSEICGQKLLFSVIFKEDNLKYFEDDNTFMINERQKKIEQCKTLCNEFLSRHDVIENLQNLTEDLYVKEDEALLNYQEALFDDSLKMSLPITETSETLKETIERLLNDIQVPGTSPKKVGEFRSEAEKYIQEYYEMYRKLWNIKLKVSKKLREMYFNYLKKMFEDKNNYQPIIFKDCAGERLTNLSLGFHKENEKIAQFNLDLHSAKNIIVERKIELIRSWSEGQDMVRVNVRHEDVSLLQLKQLNTSNVELSRVEEYYLYIKETYKLLLEYSESQILGLENLKHILDDPLSIILPSSGRSKTRFQTKTDDKDTLQSIDYSGIIRQSSNDSEFEDALDENEYTNLRKTEVERNKKKIDYDNKLKEIANKRAELRNSKAKLEVQYEKLRNKALDSTKSNFESLHFESLHPEREKFQNNSIPYGSLTAEQRREEGQKKRDRVKQYQEKLKAIPENKCLGSLKPIVKRKQRPTVSPRQSLVPVQPILPKLNSLQPPPPPPPPPPINAPPPPPPFAPPIFQSLNLLPRNSKNDGTMKDQSMGYMDELQKVFSQRKVPKTSNTIDDDISIRRKENKSNLNHGLNALIESRRQYISSIEDSD